MKTYLVNLDRCPARLAFVREQLERFSLPFERVSAVDGKSLRRIEIFRKCSQLHAFAIHNRYLMRGEIGCALSHLEVYRRMAAENVDLALVLEDDVEFTEEFPAVLRNGESFVDPAAPQVMLFSSYCDDMPDARRTGILRSPKHFWCTDAYLITLPAAKAILHENTPVVTVADSWCRWERTCGLQLYRIYPTTVRQKGGEFKTEIGKKGNRSIFMRVYLRVFGSLNPLLDRALSGWKNRNKG